MFDNDYPYGFNDDYYNDDEYYNNYIENDDNNEIIKNIGKYIWLYIIIYFTVLFDENKNFKTILFLIFPFLLFYGLYLILKYIFFKLVDIIYYLLTIDKELSYFIVMFIIILFFIKMFNKIK